MWYEKELKHVVTIEDETPWKYDNQREIIHKAKDPKWGGLNE